MGRSYYTRSSKKQVTVTSVRWEKSSLLHVKQKKKVLWDCKSVTVASSYIICTGAAILQCGIGKKCWSVRQGKSNLVDGMQYKCLWDYKSVTVVFQGFISEV